MQFIVGEVFHYLTALSRDDRYGVYRCACGNEKRILVANVRKGNTKSCGCLRKQVTAKRNTECKTTHGKTHARVYYIWVSMLARCTNPNSKDWKNYGGLSISVCDAWHKFENFYADMGEPPAKLTLERRDNTEGYNAENCRWATATEQANNRRNSVRLTHDGLTLNPTQWSLRTGVPCHTIYTRLERGWSVERTLTTPRISSTHS